MRYEFHNKCAELCLSSMLMHIRIMFGDVMQSLQYT